VSTEGLTEGIAEGIPENITEKKSIKLMEKLKTIPSKLYDNPDANNVLFVENLPHLMTEELIATLFG
jgi:hypothetical protein